MGDTTTEVDADWIKPGVEVIVYSTGRYPHPRKTTVLRVAAKSFTLDGVAERIRFEDFKSKPVGSSWDSWRYAVVHPGSDKARELAQVQRVENALSRAIARVLDWNTGDGRRDKAKLDAAIGALFAYRDLLIGGGSDDH